MTRWDMLSNANCKTEKLYYEWAYCAAGGQAKYGIDERGMLFAWGYNNVGQCGLGSPEMANYYDHSTAKKPWLVEIYQPTRIGHEANWIKVCGGEYAAMAINSKGELWGWGDGWYGGLFGLPLDPPDIAYLDSVEFLPVRCFPGTLFRDFAFGAYLVALINQDGTLTVAGTHDWSDVDGMVEGIDYQYATHGGWTRCYTIGHRPIPGFTKKVKLVAADWYAIACVTEDDEVYILGAEMDWQSGYDSNNLRQVAFDVPEGRTIVELGVCYEMVTALLDDGSLWMAGSDLSFFGAPYDEELNWRGDSEVFVQAKAGLGFVFHEMTLNDYQALMCIDQHGNLWGGGFASFKQGRVTDIYEWPGYNTDYDSFWPIVVAEWGTTQFRRGFYKPYNYCHQLITANGDMFCWGRNYWGQLGIGQAYANPTTSTLVPAKCAPATDLRGNSYGLNEDRYSLEGPFAPVPLQGPEHEPCGHWHLREYEHAEGYAINCWMISLDVTDDREVFAWGSGRWWPFQLKGFMYQLSNNTWEEIYSEENTSRSSSHPGHAEYQGEWGAYFNSVYDATGTDLWNDSLTNPRMGLWVYKDNAVTFQGFAGTKFEPGQRRMGLTAGGMIAVAVIVGANLVVKVSTDYGETFADKYSISTSGIIDYKLFVDSVGAIRLVTFLSTEYVRIMRSANNGATWTQRYYNRPLAGATQMAAGSDRNILWVYVRSLTQGRLIRIRASNDSYYAIPTETHPPLTYGVLMANCAEMIAHIGSEAYWALMDVHGFQLSESPMSLEFQDMVLEGNALSSMVLSGFNYEGFEPNGFIKLTISDDGGRHWYDRIFPLANRRTWEDLTKSKCDPMFGLRSQPGDWKVTPQWRITEPKIIIPKH